MKKNLGKADKVVRLLIALTVFSLFFLLDGNLRYLAVIGFVPLLTALVSICPLYSIFGISTCKRST